MSNETKNKSNTPSFLGFSAECTHALGMRNVEESLNLPLCRKNIFSLKSVEILSDNSNASDDIFLKKALAGLRQESFNRGTLFKNLDSHGKARSPETPKTTLDLWAAKYSLSLFEAGKELFKRLGYTEDMLFSEIKPLTASGISHRNINWGSRDPHQLLSALDKDIYFQTELFTVMDPMGYYILGFILLCTDETGYEVILTSHICGQRLPGIDNDIRPIAKLGAGFLYARLINQNLLQKYPLAIVFLCEDLRTANHLNKTIQDSKRFSGTYVATAWVGGRNAQKEIDVSSLTGRNVVFVPALSKTGFDLANVKYYHAKCISVDVASFRVLAKAVLFHPTSFNLEEMEAKLSYFEIVLCRDAIHMYERESIVMHELCNVSMTIEEYEAWVIHVGLSNPPLLEQNKQSFLAQNVCFRSHRVTRVIKRLDKMLTLEFITVLYGESDGGKGFVTASFCIGYITGKEVFGFEPFQVTSPKRAYYLNAEMSGSEFTDRLLRIANGMNIPAEMIEENFYHASLLDYKGTGHPSILDESFRDTIKQELRRTGATLLVLDNLLSLVEGAKSSQAAFKDVIDWARTLANINVSVLIVHHTNKSGDVLGSSLLESLAQNVIEIVGLKQIKERLTKKDVEFEKFRPYENSAGCLLEMRFKKCKPFPDLKQTANGYYLEYNPENPTIGPDWLHIDDNRNTNASSIGVVPETVLPENANDGTSIENDPRYQPLSKDEKNIISKLTKEGLSLKRTDVETLLNCGETKAGNLLKGLCDKSLIKSIGEGKQIRYVRL